MLSKHVVIYAYTYSINRTLTEKNRTDILFQDVYKVHHTYNTIYITTFVMFGICHTAIIHMLVFER